MQKTRFRARKNLPHRSGKLRQLTFQAPTFKRRGTLFARVLQLGGVTSWSRIHTGLETFSINGSYRIPSKRAAWRCVPCWRACPPRRQRPGRPRPRGRPWHPWSPGNGAMRLTCGRCAQWNGKAPAIQNCDGRSHTHTYVYIKHINGYSNPSNLTPWGPHKHVWRTEWLQRALQKLFDRS